MMKDAEDVRGETWADGELQDSPLPPLVNQAPLTNLAPPLANQARPPVNRGRLHVNRAQPSCGG